MRLALLILLGGLFAISQEIAYADEVYGKLDLEADPQVEVFLGDQSLGKTPLYDLKLPAGKVRLRMKSVKPHIDEAIDVTIVANTRLVKKYKF